MASTSPSPIELNDSNSKAIVVKPSVTLLAMLVLPDGSFWSAQAAAGQGKKANVFLTNAAGGLGSTLSLPTPKRLDATAEIPASEIPSVFIHGLLMDSKNTLWMTDFQYGLIYKYQTKEPAVTTDKAVLFFDNEAPLVSHAGAPPQFAGLAIQHGGLDDKGPDLLWSLDVQGALAGFDTGADVTKAPTARPAYKLDFGKGTALAFQSIIYHAATKTLWLLLAGSAETPATLLVSVKVNAAPTLQSCKFYSLPDAQTLALDGHQLYIGGSQGQIWALNVQADVSAWESPPMPAITLPLAKDKASVFSLVIDSSHHIWASTDVNPTGGEVFCIRPASGSTAAEVKANYKFKTATAPATLGWIPPGAQTPKDEALYVLDQFSNSGRVIHISPLPGLMPIDGKGESIGKLQFDPQTLDAVVGTAFGSLRDPKGIALRATLTKASAPASPQDIAIAVDLSAKPDTGVKVNAGSLIRNTLATVPHLLLTDLVIDKNSAIGHWHLAATARGGAQAEFTGNILPNVTKVGFKNTAEKRYTVQGHRFDSPEQDVLFEVTPTESTAEITVTVTGPAKLPGTSGEKTNDRAHFDRTIAPAYSKSFQTKMGELTAGLLSGDVTLAPSFLTLTGKPMIWTVIAKPTALKANVSQKNLSLRQIDATLGTMSFALTGHQRLDDDKSAVVPVPHWKLRLTLSNKGAVQFVDAPAYPDAKAATDGLTLIQPCDDKGMVVLHPQNLKAAGAVTARTFTIKAQYQSDLGDIHQWMDPPDHEVIVKFTAA